MSEIFWSPGVLTQIENPYRVASKKYWGWGLELSQIADKAKGADNWFHIGIPCKSRTHYVGGTVIEKFILRAEVNMNARIKTIHLRDGRHLIVEKNVNFTDTDVFVEFKRPSKNAWISFGSMASGITVCVRVEFSTGQPLGTVTFLGAAVQLDPS
jgi:hypothetical protein